MRARTLVAAGTAAAAVAYLVDARRERAGRDRARATVPTSPRDRVVREWRPTGLPPNLAPLRSERPTALEDPPARSPEEVTEASGSEPMPAPTPDRLVDDAAIAQAVRSRLGERRDLRTQDLVVDVVNGVAYLSGGLHDRQTFGEIVDLTSDVPGIRRVQSLLHLPDSETIVRTLTDHRDADDD